MESWRILREARRRAGLTQRELAERAGTSQSAIARWESGRVRPSLERLRELVGACGLELDTSLSHEDSVESALLERTLALTPGERLDQLARSVNLILEGRRSLARRFG